ncbi:hypothetical protein INT45_004039 [Circinella minor]|uniref:Fe-S cluster assembly protein DRE2 n=1 Tax=Circinella minor TaxID=1195481 RepID=A0A8H7S181_9FUNG|nr:hypothetical protein INT45_004039 [Circinella minor]
MVVANFEASQGESVLFVSPASVNQDALVKAKNTTGDQVGASGKTAFEAMERVAEAPLSKSSYNKIYSNAIPPINSVHTPQVLSRFLSTLIANGTLVLFEPVALEDLDASLCPVTRKEADLVSLLKLTGFVDVNVTSVEPVSDADLAEFVKAWGAVRVEQGVGALSGKLGVARIEVKKPAYEVGQKMTLNFRKKKTAETPAATKKSVWTVSGNDDNGEDELEDEDALLDDDDLVKPSKESLARPDDCEMVDGRRKACKNCTCGRAGMDVEDESDNVVSLDLMEDDDNTSDDVVDVDPTPKEVGGCGSCALGDAFRCSTCPYLGMPAFNPGEKITLGGMFEKDDIDI